MEAAQAAGVGGDCTGLKPSRPSCGLFSGTEDRDWQSGEALICGATQRGRVWVLPLCRGAEPARRADISKLTGPLDFLPGRRWKWRSKTHGVPSCGLEEPVPHRILASPGLPHGHFPPFIIIAQLHPEIISQCPCGHRIKTDNL